MRISLIDDDDVGTSNLYNIDNLIMRFEKVKAKIYQVHYFHGYYVTSITSRLKVGHDHSTGVDLDDVRS